MNLPEDIEKMVIEIGKEVEMQVQAPVAEEEESENLSVDSKFLEQAIITAHEEACREYMDDPGYFPHAMIRRKPDVLLGEKATRKRVCTIEDLLKLTSRLTKMEVTPYWGNDHERLLVVKAQIPKTYEARVGFIRVKHVPDIYFNNIKFVDLKPPGKKEKGKISLVLDNLEPIWTRESLEEVDRLIILKNYNYVTFKIDKESHSLVSWFPGCDIRSGLCESLEEEFVGLEKKSDIAIRMMSNEK